MPTMCRLRSSAVLACLLVACAAVWTVAAAESAGNSTSTDDGILTEDEQQQDEAENVAEHPFLEVYGLLNGSWAKFFVIVVASSRLAVIFPRLGLPLITGYMILGCLCGPYVLGLVTKPQIPDLSYVTQTALAFIALSAGSELYLPELRSLLRTIALITGFNALFSYIFCGIFIYLIALGGVVPWMEPYLGSCGFSISMVAAAIMVARSPASAIAVVREIKAKGPATSIMLGVTVVGDVVVLILFTLSNSFALALCGGGGFDGGAFFITLLTLCVAVGLGYGLGFLFIFLLSFDFTGKIPWMPSAPGKYSILPIGFLIFVLCDWMVVWTEHHWGVGLNFDALLICITAGYVVTNRSANRVPFIRMLGAQASFVFIPFFTLVGVQLNLEILVQSIGFGFLVFFMRGLCVAAGSFVGGTLAGLDLDKRKKLWMTMLAQAGVSLGLAAEVAVKFPEWGSKFQTTIISVVLINQFVGPVLCKAALKGFGEAGKMIDGEDDEHGHGEDHAPKKLKRAVLCGVDSTTLALAAKLLKAGWRITLLDRTKANLVLAKSLGIAKKDTRTNLSVEAPAAAAPTTEEAMDESAALFTDGSSSSSLAADSASVDIAPLVEKEPVLDLLLVDSKGGLIQSFSGALEECTPEAVILGLNDADNYELGSFFLRVRHFSRVLARVTNPSWTNSYVSAGLLPVSAFGAVAAVLSASATSRGNLQVVSATLTLPDALKSLISPVEDLSYLQLPMSGEQRVEWEEAHPAPTEDVLADIGARLTAAGVGTVVSSGVRLLETVSHSERADYIDKLGQLHSLEHEDIDLSAADQEKNRDIFMSISGHASNDQDKKAARLAEMREQEEEDKRQVEMALARE